jgi:hypothetical protein
MKFTEPPATQPEQEERTYQIPKTDVNNHVIEKSEKVEIIDESCALTKVVTEFLLIYLILLNKL